MNSIYKAALTTAVLASALTLGASAAYADDVKVSVNGQILQTSAQIVNDRTMVPLRAVSNALGTGVAWDADTRGILLYRYGKGNEISDTMAMCWIDRDHGFGITGLTMTNTAVMDVPPTIINDSTYVPLRAVSELLGAKVDWNGETRTAIVQNSYIPAEFSDADAISLLPYEKMMSERYDAYSAYVDKRANTVKVEMTVNDGGVIELALYPDLAPVTVANFVKLADEGFYDGMLFHRVIKDFVIQGGGFSEDGTGKAAANIEGEFIQNGFLNLIPHKRGVISMARTAYDLNSASSQFFIMHKDNDSLDGQYAAFGEVVSGMEYVDKIAKVNTDSNDIPTDKQIIRSVRIIR